MEIIYEVHRHGKEAWPPAPKNYDPDQLMKELMDAVVEVYRTTNEINATAIELSLPPNKEKKLLITSQAIYYLETEQIQALQAQGESNRRDTGYHKIEPCLHQ